MEQLVVVAAAAATKPLALWYTPVVAAEQELPVEVPVDLAWDSSCESEGRCFA